MEEIEQEAGPTVGPEKGLHMLFIDGGKKANAPGESVGEAAIAAILKDPGGKKVLAQTAMKIEPVSDPHVAEYRAFIAGLELAKANDIEYVVVFSDSRTVVNQLNGRWQRNAPHLDVLHAEATEHLVTFPHGGVQISWIPREWNKEPHALVAAELFREEVD